MAGMSPTQLSLRWARSMGYTAQVVEHWNPHARIRQDLFGIIDILCVGSGETMAIQSTSWKNVPSRITKMQEAESIATLVESGWIVIAQGWKKEKNRWISRQYLITPEGREEYDG